ncbi:TetR/AcrR family transcriptional regulator [Novosphingobium album (ex Liu et al. 2023)]|uniref:TetR/AcrR family transcriptional regulator n=1 Tax=Novosphingobium album (ex Liu et al. 2023) TaxID=3031130 RepID=A0ABT5WX68_9SPHN|nr:TetR/AcrR family transcriptional regulator [Novosphingobium album (ex Liu et al. 2023)]MDE8654500.1 TetR/AcrR family transcriptional regulator [Novosphingobium album (ex Liu et al. 2023)]
MNASDGHTPANAATASVTAGRRRLSPEQRRHLILEAAADFFAEFGFDAQMTDLAQRIGISHSLIFRYFPTKLTLIEAVYDHVHLQLWARVWGDSLEDRGRPLARRIEDFLLAYLEAVDNPRWVRIGLYAGLGHITIENKRLLTGHVAAAMDRIIGAVEEEYGHSIATTPSLRQELGWHLYSSLIFWLMRKYVLDRPHEEDKQAFVALIVRNFLNGLQPGETPDPTS